MQVKKYMTHLELVLQIKHWEISLLTKLQLQYIATLHIIYY